eukprot:364253-Chlamydomonas_euryale.AAC.5
MRVDLHDAAAGLDAPAAVRPSGPGSRSGDMADPTGPIAPLAISQWVQGQSSGAADVGTASHLPHGEKDLVALRARVVCHVDGRLPAASRCASFLFVELQTRLVCVDTRRRRCRKQPNCRARPGVLDRSHENSICPASRCLLPRMPSGSGSACAVRMHGRSKAVEREKP